MEKEYLQKVHSKLNISHDFDTWVNKVKNNDDYLSKVHSKLGVTHDYSTWKQKVIGESVPVIPEEYGPTQPDYSQWQVIEEVDGISMSLFKDPDGNNVAEEDVPEELKKQYYAYQEQPGQAKSFKEYMLDTKGDAYDDQGIIQTIDSHKLIGKDLENVKIKNRTDLENYYKLVKKRKELDISIERQAELYNNKTPDPTSSNINFGGMQMVDPSAGEVTGNINNTQNQLGGSNTAYGRKEAEKNRIKLEQEQQENRKGLTSEISDNRITRILKEIKEGKHGEYVNNRVEKGVFIDDLIADVMTKEDADAHFKKSVNDYIENNTGLFDFKRTDSIKEKSKKTDDLLKADIPNPNFDVNKPEGPKNKKFISKIDKALKDNIRSTHYSYDNITKLQKKLTDFEASYQKNVAPKNAEYKKQFELKTTELQKLEKEKQALGEVNQDSDISLINQWNAINDKQNALITDQKNIQASQEKLFKDNATMIADYKKASEDLGMWVKDYKDRVVLSGELAQNAEDLVAYQNLIKRNNHNVVAGGAWLTTSAVSLASGLEGFINSVKELPEDLLFEYYDNDYKKMPNIVKQLKGYDKFTDAMRLAKKEKVNNFITNLNNSVQEVEDFDNIDNAADLGVYALHGLANFAPQVALMAATGGASIYVMGASAFGNKYDEMERSNAFGSTEYSLAEKWLASTITGGSEILSEKVTFDIFKGVGKEMTKRIKDRGFKAAMQNFSINGTLKATGTAGMESGSEVLAQIGGNIADKFVLGKDISLTDGVKGAAFTGLIMERSMSMPAVYNKLSPIFMGKDYMEQIQELNKKQREFGDIIADPNTSSLVRDKFEAQWKKIQKKKEKLMSNNVRNIDKMKGKEKNRLVNIENSLHNLKKEQDEINSNKEISFTEKQTLIKELNAEEQDLLTEKNRIIRKYEDPKTKEELDKKYEEEKAKIQSKIDAFNARQADRNVMSEAMGGTRKTGKLTEMATKKEQLKYFKDKIKKENDDLASDIATLQGELQNNDNLTEADKKQYNKIIKNFQQRIKQNVQESKSNASAFGFIIQNKDGSFEVVLNKENSIAEGGNINVAAHEFLHATLYKTIGGNKDIQDKLGQAVADYVRINKGGFNQDFINKMSPYAFAENAGEEIITVMSESIRDGSLKFNDGFFTKIGDLIRQNLQRVGIIGIKFNTGRDVYNFIKDYNASIEKGYDSKAIDRLMDFGAEGSLVQLDKKVDNAPNQQIQKSTPIGFQNETIVEELGLSKETQAIVAKNKEIQDKILAEGLKDKDGNIMASISLANALVRNNMPRAFALAKKAANKGKDLTLEDALKMDDVAEWFSLFNEKLVKLSRTYRARKNGKEVPFGAYMNAILPKKYSGILEKAKSKIETDRMSDEATAKKVAKKTAPKKDNNKREEIEGTAVALETIGQANVMPKLRSVYSKNKSKVARQKTYKDVKNAIVKAKKEGPYFQALLEISEIFSEGTFDGKPFKIDPAELAKRIRIKQDLTKPMRKVIQDVILKYSPEMINMIPGGTSASGDATGIANTNLGKAWFIKKGKTKFAETGSRKGLPIQDKKGLNMQTFLAPFGLGERGNRAKTKDIDGALREWIMQVATLAMNQASRQADPQNISLLSTKDGKNPIQFSKPAEVIFGGIKSILTPEQGQEFENNIAQFVSNFVGINESKMTDAEKEQVLLSEDTEAIEIALDQVYGNVFSKEIKSKIANEIAMQVGKLNLNPKAKRITKVQKIVDQIIKSTDAAQVKVAKFTSSNLTAKEAQDLAVRQETRRKADGVYFKRQFKKNKEQAIADLILIAGHSTTSGKIGKGRGQYYEGTKDFYDTNLGKVGIKPVYDTFKRSGKTVYTLNVEKTAEANNLKEIPVTKASQSTGGAMSDHAKALEGDTAKLDARREHESHARRVLNDYVAFNVEQYDNGLQDNVDIMLMMTSLLSNMNSVLARAGALNLVQPGVTAKNGRYEHGHPRVAVLIRLMNHHLNKGGVKNLDAFFKNYDVNIIDTNFDDAITDAGYKETLADGQTFEDPSYDRMYNKKTFGDKRVKLLVEAGTNNTPQKIQDFINGSIQFSKVPELSNFNKNNTIQKAIQFSKNTRNKTKGITVLDFDDTLATTKSLVRYTKPDGTTGTLNAEQYAKTYEDLLDKGYIFDFSDFNKVVKGKIAPLFQKALKLQNKFGPENMFVLTARPAASAQAIYDFLTANGLNIPLQNITGLANSTSEAKALWIADKVGKGYNDFYFADDALQNVQAVKNMLDQFDVKSKVQQAKIQFSKGVSDGINDIIEQNTGVKKESRFSSAEARARGMDKGKYKVWIPPGAEDFMGLMYTLASAKGKKGEAQLDFIRKALLDPYNNGVSALNAAKQELSGNYKALLKQHPDIKKLFNKKIEGTNFTYEHAIRVYLWDRAGYEIPGIAEGTKKKLLDTVKDISEMSGFADSLGKITKVEQGYPEPDADWVADTIIADLANVTDELGRSDFLQEFINNANEMFNKENLNKIEAIYGRDYRDALENMLYRMKTGKNQSSGTTDAQVNRWTMWIRNSVGAIMFVNTRSAILQTISAANFINWSDNNPVKAAMAFANQKQFWSDFSMIFNSPFLKQRRAGLKTDVNEARLAAAIQGKKNKAKAAIAYLLKIGFLPTQIADSFAIASGGASFYRNRVNKLIKDGMSRQEAEAQAFQDVQDVSNISQQSADPSLLSRQQTSILGAFILAFQNTPMQYARIMKKAGIDLIKGRGDWKTNVSKIVYYGALQNLIFNAMQQALFALAFDDEDDEKELARQTRLANGMLDSILRGTGIYGAVVATGKNIAIEFWKQDQKGGRADHAYTLLQFANISPPIGSKMRKLYSATQTRKFNKKAMEQMGYDIYNPAVPAVATAVEAFTNLPTGRLYQKFNNVSEALKEENENWQRIALMMGWNTWDVGIKQKKTKGKSLSKSISKSIKSTSKSLSK